MPLLSHKIMNLIHELFTVEMSKGVYSVICTLSN